MFGKKTEDWLIVGLGNPGKEYEKTRHNAGWRAVDLLADKLGCKIDKAKFQGLYGQTKYGSGKLFLLKPMTYMNLSGRSVLQLSAYFHIPPQRIIVLFDDISLEPGRLRIRADGSAGGHNGIKNIIAHLGTQEFPRVKIGVAAPQGGGAEMVDHVLGVPSQEERKVLAQVFEKAVDAAECIVQHGYQKAMNQFN